MPIPALLAAAPGLIKAGASLFGGGKRRRAEKKAQAEFQSQQEALKNFQFENPYANQENVFEDATVNQQATNFQAAQTDQALAGAQQSIVESGGGGGGAAALVSGALGAKQGASADLARQEQGNQQASLQNQAALQSQEAQGEATLQTQRHGQVQQQFNLAQQGLQQAQQARQQARADLVGGLSGAAGGIASAGTAAIEGGGSFGDIFKRQKDNPLKRLYTPLKNTEGAAPSPEDVAALQSELDTQGKSNAAFTQLSGIYGRGDTRGHGVTSKNYQDQLAAYKGKHGADASEKAFKDLYEGGYDEEGGLNPYAQSRADAYKQAAGLTAEDEASFRSELQDNYNVLGGGLQAKRSKALAQALGGDEFRGLSTGPIADILKNQQRSGKGFEGDDLNRVTEFLEGRARGGSGTGKKVGKLLQDFYADDKYARAAYEKKQAAEAPTKRSPLYRMFRMKYKGMYK